MSDLPSRAHTGRLLPIVIGLVISSSLLPAVAPRADASTSPTLSTTPSVPPAPLDITTSPGLFPSFKPSVSDYVIRCTGAPIPVAVSAPPGSEVAIADQPAASGTFVVRVTATPGQSFTLAITDGGGTTMTAHVRCLPLDFPIWVPLATDPGTTPQAQFYVVSPISPATPTGTAQYLALFDTNDVPVWWVNTTTSAGSVGFGTLLTNGDVAWTTGNGSPAEVRALDGSTVRTIAAPAGQTDEHELIALPNGDYLVGARVIRPGVSLASWGGDATSLTNVSIFDFLFYELSPTGAVVWSWDTFDHIPVSETDPQWRSTLLRGGAPYDVYHWNSLDPYGGTLLASFRHLDAVYNIDRGSGNIVWKLGGSGRPDATSLAIAGDPVFAGGSGFGGQHDARFLPDGTVTVYDDQTGRAGTPRAVRYAISAGSATMVETVSDPLVTSTICCGSARKLPGSDWVLSGGFTSVETELTSSGQRAWGMRLPSTLSYRTIPVMPGMLAIDQLRQGMDAQATGHATTSRAITVARLSGADAIATAVAISQHDWAQPGSETGGPMLPAKFASAVVIAGSGLASTDALVAAPLAVAKNAPLLLNGPSGLDPRNLAEIARVLPGGGPPSVVGGPAVIGPGIDTALEEDRYQVTRLAGSDRYSTAVAVADNGLDNPATIVEATGLGAADALVSGPAAAHAGGAVLLTDGPSQAEPTAAYLTSHPRELRYAVGGPASLADPGATAIVGADRYQTATMVAAQFFASPPAVLGIADGDAASAGASIGTDGGALLLSTGTLPAPATTASYLNDDTAVVIVDEYGSATSEPFPLSD